MKSVLCLVYGKKIAFLFLHKTMKNLWPYFLRCCLILSEDRIFPIFLPSSKNFMFGWFIDITSKKNLERKSNQIFWPTKYQHIRDRKSFQHQQETKTWSKFFFMVSFDCDSFLLKSRLIFNFFLFSFWNFCAKCLPASAEAKIFQTNHNDKKRWERF